MLSLLPSLLVLGLAALAALLLALRRTSPSEKGAERVSAATSLAIATAIQTVHFVEEVSTGFHEKLGPLFGLPELPFVGFVIFNVAWIGIWIASVPGIRSSRTAAYFAAWFLAIAGIFNGIAHPLLAVSSGGYFPGLLSSPIIAIAAAVLWLRLRKATSSLSI